MTFEELIATLDNNDLRTCERCKRGEIYEIHAPYPVTIFCKVETTRPKTGYWASKLNRVMQSGLCAGCETEVNKRKYDALNHPTN